jgi:hypothetical protein
MNSSPNAEGTIAQAAQTRKTSAGLLNLKDGSYCTTNLGGYWAGGVIFALKKYLSVPDQSCRTGQDENKNWVLIVVRQRPRS